MAVTAGLLIGGAAIAAGTAIAGEVASADDREEANRMRRQALSEFENLSPQNYEDLERMLGQWREEGLMDPQLESSIRQGDTELRNMRRDPELMEAQMGALNYLQEVAEQGGMTAEDRQRFQQLSRSVNSQIRGQREAIEQGFRARGMSGSGLEMASALQAQQSGAQRMAETSLGIEAMAERRALEAQLGRAGLAGDIRRQEMDISRSQDIINRFNAQQEMQRQQWEQGEAYRRRVEGLRSQAALRGQQFGEEAQVAAGRAGQLGQQAQASEAEAARQRAMWGGIGQTVAGAMGAGAGYAAAAPSAPEPTPGPTPEPWEEWGPQSNPYGTRTF
jgi:hypothetical protein